MSRSHLDPRDWERAQHYIERLFAPEDTALKRTLRQSQRSGLPPISVSRAGGKLLYLLAKTVSAQRILEVGTLGGYSAIWLARALPPGGRLVSLEMEPAHAAVAKKNLAKAGLAKKAEVLTGSALKLMQEMVRSRRPLFDLVFIDADKEEYPDYLRLACRLVRKGGLIVADNALRRPVSLEDAEISEVVRRNGVAECNRLAAAHPRLVSLIVPVLGKGVDGMLVCLKK